MENQHFVYNLISNYNPVIKVKSTLEMKIILKDDIPIYQRPGRLPYSDRVIVDKHVEGIIQPSFSEYATPVVLSSK